MPPAAVTSISSVIIILTLVHPFATSWPSSPKGDARTLRDWLSVSYSMISILVISRCAAPPYPATPDFLHGKACHTILRSLCSLTNRVPLPPHPGDRINRSMLSCRNMAPLLSTHSPTVPRGEGGAVRHQRGKTPKWYVKYMTRCFSSPYFSFPLEGNASKRQRVYKAERRFDTPSRS